MEITKIEAAAEFDLFGMIHGCQVVSGPRVANDDECRAYARWLAMKAGIVEAVTNSPALEWRTVGDKRNRFCIGAYFGDAFVAFPGADQTGAVTFELLDESGNVETIGTIYAKPNGALNVSPSDAAAIKESGKAWAKANKGKAKAAPVAVAPPIDEPAPVALVSGELATWHCSKCGSNTHNSVDSPMPQNCWKADCDGFLFYSKIAPEIATETPQDATPATTLAETPEIAPQDEKNGLADDVEAQPDPIAALIARMDQLESRLECLSSVELNPQNNSPRGINAPSVGISEPAPLSGELKPKRSPAHIRAIMAYLAMRKERNAERKHNAIGMEQLDAMRADRDDWHKQAWDNAETIMNERLAVIAEKEKRRRAILKALHVRQSLKRSRDIAADRLLQIVDTSAERSKAWNERDAVKAELAELRRKIADPSNPFRLSDMVAINDKAGEYQARAERAEAESERLRRLAVQNAGHIETLASRIARAETLLRESGQMPVLSIVPPSNAVAA
jgi:hypothetical protein